MHAVFVDFSSAFDSGSRTLTLEMLARGGVPWKLLDVLRAMLQENRITIDDGVTSSATLVQTNGFAQG